MQHGDWEWTALETGRFRLDGGSMFGNVPKVLWEKSCPADEHNRIRMGLRSLLLRRGDRVILVDTGMGDKWSEKQLAMYHVDYGEFNMARALSDAGVTPADITDVVLTHLHFDHAGGATCREGDEIVPAFPNASYHIQRANLETAKTPNIRERASYLGENFLPLEAAGCLVVHDGDGEIVPGLEVRVSNGHTLGMQTVTVRDHDGRTLSYLADLIPMRPHVCPTFSMGYDIQPVLVIEEKQRFLDEVVGEDGLLFFEHDPDVAACRLGKDKRGRHAAGEPVLTVA